MGWIWTGMLAVSLLCSLWNGQAGGLSAAAMEGAQAGITLAITMAGPLCLWSSAARIMESIGWTDRLSRWLSPLLYRLFPQAWSDQTAREALCGNLSANLLGLGNAATPFGIRAVQQMALDTNGRASDELCRLVVLNTASIQLLPATVAAVRSALGAAAPFDILPAVWISSICSVSAGLLAAKVFSRWVR